MLFSAGVLGVAMMPPMGPEQSPGGSLVGKAPRSPEDLILCNDLHLLKSLGLVSSRVILTSWGEVASLASVDHPPSDSVTIKIPYVVGILIHRPALHPIVSIGLFKT